MIWRFIYLKRPKITEILVPNFAKNINLFMEYERLLEIPIWQMTGQELCSLIQYAYTQCIKGVETNDIIRITGVRALAQYLDCCESTVFMLRRNGVLDEAILSQVGKKIVFDGEKARILAAAFQQEQRAARRENG